MLRLLPEANGILNPRVGQQWTSNSTYDLTPVHGRTNNVLRARFGVHGQDPHQRPVREGPRR